MEEKEGQSCPVRSLPVMGAFDDSPLRLMLEALIDVKTHLPFAKIVLPNRPSKEVPAELLAWAKMEEDLHFEAFRNFLSITVKKERWKNLKPAQWTPKRTACQIMDDLSGIPLEIGEAIERYIRSGIDLNNDMGFEEEEAVHAASIEILVPAFSPETKADDIGALLALYKAGLLRDKEYKFLTSIPASPGWKAVLKKIKKS